MLDWIFKKKKTAESHKQTLTRIATAMTGLYVQYKRTNKEQVDGVLNHFDDKVVAKVPGPYVRGTSSGRPTKVPYIPTSQAPVLAGGWRKPGRLMHVAAMLAAWTLAGNVHRMTVRKMQSRVK